MSVDKEEYNEYRRQQLEAMEKLFDEQFYKPLIQIIETIDEHFFKPSKYLFASFQEWIENIWNVYFRNRHPFELKKYKRRPKVRKEFNVEQSNEKLPMPPIVKARAPPIYKGISIN